MKAFREKRASVNPELLAKYRRQWVAFALDDCRLVAGSENLVELDELIRAAGEDPQNVALEYVGDDDSFVVGAESF